MDEFMEAALNEARIGEANVESQLVLRLWMAKGLLPPDGVADYRTRPR